MAKMYICTLVQMQQENKSFWKNTKRCSKKTCCKPCRQVKLKDTKTNTYNSTIHKEQQDITNIQNKLFFIVFGFLHFYFKYLEIISPLQEPETFVTHSESMGVPIMTIHSRNLYLFLLSHYTTWLQASSFKDNLLQEPRLSHNHTTEISFKYNLHKHCHITTLQASSFKDNLHKHCHITTLQRFPLNKIYINIVTLPHCRDFL